ncbi:hypothetical protein [Burkholderia metallica]|uniref:hypothetical protein n=1 Tax=Burkholderia metallica TaxID=488729 RepID=UPI00131DC142|nr:hypothetical protein [Burkholderia metallica]
MERSASNARGEDYVKIVRSLLGESERAAVVLAAARLDVELENAIKHVLMPFPGGNDPLFDADRALGTFSAKILIAHRLGIISLEFEHALQILRKIRNDFAHQIETSSLSNDPQRGRLETLYSKFKCSEKFRKVEQMVGGLEAVSATPEQRKLVACCSTMIAILGNSTPRLGRVNVGRPINVVPKED